MTKTKSIILLFKIIKWSCIVTIGFLIFCNLWILTSTNKQIIVKIDDIEKADVGLVLGTSRLLKGGKNNPFFDNRIEAANDLIENKKVKQLLLSGSKDSIYYNEPIAMKNALLELGVNKNQLILDDQGDRTLISLLRLYENHDYKNCIIVTQKYHAYRTLFIANHIGIEAVCYPAKEPNVQDLSLAMLRETLARTKAILDIYVLGY